MKGSAAARRLLRIGAITGLAARTTHAFGRHAFFAAPPRAMAAAMAMSTNTPDVTRFITQARPEATKQYVMQQTMVRVKDPVKSLEFYCDVLGFSLIMFREFPQWEFNVYFVAPIDPALIPEDEDGRWALCMSTPGCIELTYNYGSEAAEGAVYNTGNSDPTGSQDGQPVKGGFGHLGITVPDVYEACERFQEMGCEFVKTPNSGGMKGLAFVKDPDNYLVEILPLGKMITKPVDCAGVEIENSGGYVDKSKA